MDLIRNLQTRIYNALCRLKWEAGQTTAEYALVLLAAAAIAVLLITWAKDTDTLNTFFDTIIGKITEKANAGD